MQRTAFRQATLLATLTSLPAFAQVSGPIYKPGDGVTPPKLISKGDPASITPSASNKLEVDRVLGKYRREPVANDWHQGVIERDGDQSLRWRNEAGMSWTLTPDFPNGILWTGTENPYYDNDPERGRVFRLVLRKDSQGNDIPSVLGFKFNGEFYAKVEDRAVTSSDESVNKTRAPGGGSSPDATARQPKENTSPSGRRVYTEADGISGPKVLHRVDPSYTEAARRAQFSGTNLLRAVIDVDGKAKDIRVVKGIGYGLDEKAIECVRQWIFAPATKDGKPVPFEGTIELNFRLLDKLR
jgi:TonB family protein